MSRPRLPGKLPSSPRVSPITGTGDCSFLLRTSIITSTAGNRFLFGSALITSTCGCLSTFLVFDVFCSFFAQIRHTVGYLVIPTRTGLRSAKMSEQQTTRPRSRSNARGCISGYVIACNIKWCGTASIRSRVLVDHCWKTLSSLRTLVYECNTP